MPVAGRAPDITLRASELEAYRAAVIDCAGEDERQACETLLGQIAFLETGPGGTTGADEIAFTPPPASADLARRSVERMRSEMFRRRRRSAAR